MLKLSSIIVLSTLAAVIAFDAPAQAQRGSNWPPLEAPFQRGSNAPSSQWDVPRQERAPEREKSLSEILRDLKREYGGQHLDARREGNVYVITWITEEGRRLTLRIDPSR